MKLITFFSFLIVLSLLSIFNITTNFVQASPQWHLPEGAVARFGNR